MSTNYSTTKQPYHRLSKVAYKKIEPYLSEGLKPAEIARISDEG
ncbi:conserved domain protein [Streptococcus sp. oral taxon 056 str. F0418]|nr:conserved domain protein [Streptococcus sp. oral taxon 056 str. F0418]